MKTCTHTSKWSPDNKNPSCKGRQANVVKHKINLVLLSLKILIKFEEEHRIIPFIIQAKKFLKGDWLKRLEFQLNLKYLHAGISFP